MAIEDSVSLIAIIILYSPAVFTLNFCCNFIVSCFYPPFWRPKGCKRHSTEKISRFLLCSRIFAYENIPRSSFACRQLSLDSRGLHKFGRALRVRKLAHLFRAYRRTLPVILTVLYFFEVTVAVLNAKQLLTKVKNYGN